MRYFFFLPLLFLVLFFTPSFSYAQTPLPSICDAAKATVDSNNNFNTVLTINTGAIADGTALTAYIYPGDTKDLTKPTVKTSATVSNSSVAFNLGKLSPGKHTLILDGILPGFPRGTRICQGDFEVPDGGQGGNTRTDIGTITFTPQNPTRTQQVTVRVEKLPADAIYFISFAKKDDATQIVMQCLQSSNKEFTTRVGPFLDGIWEVNVLKNSNQTTPITCTRGSGETVAKGQITISSPLDISPTPIPSFTPPCAPEKYDKLKGCLEINTGLGIWLPTQPLDFIRALYSLLLSISGAIAVVLFIMAGYKYMTSQGEPEKIKEAQGEITSAIIGLLFLIFSMVILQVIGVDILRIPFFQ